MPDRCVAPCMRGDERNKSAAARPPTTTAPLVLSTCDLPVGDDRDRPLGLCEEALDCREAAPGALLGALPGSDLAHELIKGGRRQGRNRQQPAKRVVSNNNRLNPCGRRAAATKCAAGDQIRFQKRRELGSQGSNGGVAGLLHHHRGDCLEGCRGARQASIYLLLRACSSMEALGSRSAAVIGAAVCCVRSSGAETTAVMFRPWSFLAAWVSSHADEEGRHTQVSLATYYRACLLLTVAHHPAAAAGGGAGAI